MLCVRAGHAATVHVRYIMAAEDRRVCAARHSYAHRRDDNPSTSIGLAAR